jgi:hypothetical protein
MYCHVEKGVVLSTYKTGFGLDDWIYCTLYIHTVRDYRQYNATLHTSQFTVTHALGFSVYTSRILATDFIEVSLLLQIILEDFFSQPNSFLPMILQLSTQFNFPAPELISWQAGVSKLSSSESESYVTTDGQSASLSWYKAPIRSLRPDFSSVRNTSDSYSLDPVGRPL